jgi:hypothetical protein
MQHTVTMPALWDAEVPGQHRKAALERATYAQSQQDWKIAETQVERVIADMYDRPRVCALSRCRRARSCRGNPPLCWTNRTEPKPAKVQDAIEKAYVRMQEERHAAAREGRAPRVLRPVRYKRRTERG